MRESIVTAGSQWRGVRVQWANVVELCQYAAAVGKSDLVSRTARSGAWTNQVQELDAAYGILSSGTNGMPELGSPKFTFEDLHEARWAM